ncbi:MAG: hypothetical protein IPO41_04535 [Acidobacteria bacterium]|nr:hypothetical protein [Acidobacteriota bacterium]MBP7474640.1 hypothetical protein [Pyrinomonadaceae bacterium]MBP9108751.1 hypothetical protein [Pyrinomonadaceae bacterium]
MDSFFTLRFFRSLQNICTVIEQRRKNIKSFHRIFPGFDLAEYGCPKLDSLIGILCVDLFQ